MPSFHVTGLCPDVAVRLGRYDLAHFINDFRSMLGSTPGEYANAHGG